MATWILAATPVACATSTRPCQREYIGTARGGGILALTIIDFNETTAASCTPLELQHLGLPPELAAVPAYVVHIFKTAPSGRHREGSALYVLFEALPLDFDRASFAAGYVASAGREYAPGRASFEMKEVYDPPGNWPTFEDEPPSFWDLHSGQPGAQYVLQSPPSFQDGCSDEKSGKLVFVERNSRRLFVLAWREPSDGGVAEQGGDPGIAAD